MRRPCRGRLSLVGPLTAAMLFASSAFAEDDGAALPKLLSDADAQRYEEIFALQRVGRNAQADRVIAKLVDPILLGHVQAQRYLHPTSHRSSWTELRDWLAAFSDHPDVKRIYRLAMRRKPAAAHAPKRPKTAFLSGSGDPAILETSPAYRSPKPRDKATKTAVRSILAEIGRRNRRGWPTGALELLLSEKSRRLLDAAEHDRAQAEIARLYYFYGKDREALDLASASLKRSARFAPMANWTAGLAAWRLGDYAAAGGFFQTLAEAPDVTDWSRAGGGYWAARAYLRTRNPDRVGQALGLAGRYPRTFYGLLARRALGLRVGFDWRRPELTRRHLARLRAEPGGRRALALLQVGESGRAEAELRKLYPGAGADLVAAKLALATNSNMPSLSLRLGVAMDDGAPMAALYPVPSWRPKDGFTVDRALLFAVMRQESGFNARAKSRAGARGLMQLMPRTASFIGADKNLRGGARDKLYEPEFNLELGQRYLAHLLAQEEIAGDLFLAVAAYNGGPGRLNQWRRQVRGSDDSLLFIESMPAPETRAFIKRVFTNLWMYRARLSQDTPSMDAVAAGDWPRYTPLDSPATAVAEGG